MTRRIVALGGGGFSNDPLDPAGRRLDQVVLDATGAARPRLLWIGTASGDAETYALKFYQAFAGRAELDDLNLFERPRHPGLREFVLGFDAVYVGGGSTLNLMAVWRAHGLDAILAEAWDRGVVLAGMSAGMICWFEAPVTDSFGDGLRAIEGLGLLPGSACAHGSDRPRRDAYAALVVGGVPGGYSADDGVALVFDGTELVEAVADGASASAGADRVTAGGLEPLAVRRLV
ncbi:MAG: peptidase E [Chloroflexota bacterium]